MREASLPVSAVPGSRPAPARVALLVLLAVVGASLVRPWGGGGPGAPDRAGAPVTNAVGGSGPVTPSGANLSAALGSPAPTATAPPRPTPGPGEIACAEGVWRVVSLERLGGWTVRSSMPAAARAARSPLDPAIGAVTLQSPAILGLGVCSPDDPGSAGGGGGGPMRILRAWRLDGGAATPFPVATAGGPRPAGLAILYRAAATGGPGAGAWPVGTFVVELGPPGGAAVADVDPSPRWFMGLVVRLPG